MHHAILFSVPAVLNLWAMTIYLLMEISEGSDEIKQCLLKYIYPEFTVPFGRLYKSSIQRKNKLFFDTYLYSGEDTLWVSQYLLCVHSLRVSSILDISMCIM